MVSQQAQFVLRVIDMQLQALRTIESELAATLPGWRDRTIRLLSRDVPQEELKILGAINASSYEGDRRLYEEYLLTLQRGVNTAPEVFLVSSPDGDATAPVPVRAEAISGRVHSPGSRRVFVVHGHDSWAKVEVARTIESLGLEAVVLHEQANEGRTVIEKFEKNASDVGFAVVLLTPDDVGHPVNKQSEAKPRARQNVVLELGFFSGALGRSRVLVLYKGDVEIPSDYLGVVYTPFDENGAWRFALAKEMKAAGIDIDLNRLI